MRLHKLILCLILAPANHLVYASDDHDHGEHDGEGLIIEGGECVGLLGHSGALGPFVEGSEEWELSEDVAACNICLDQEFTEEQCLDHESRESLLAPLVESVEVREGRRVGAKVFYQLVGVEEKIEFVCHFHDIEAGEIDCH